MGNALIYVRVSSEDQALRGYSLAAQEEDCRRRASQLGYTDEQILMFRDEGFSGDDLDRPGLVRLREAVRARSGDAVIIYDPDRFARNLTHQLIITDEIVGAGLRLEFVNFEWKNTAEGRLFYSLRGAIAEYEKAKIKERSIRGRLQKAKSGKLNGDPRLYGYTYDAETDTLYLNADEARVIRLMYEWLLEGREGKRLSCQAIARALATEGIPAPRGGKWYGSSVTRILKNDTYLGTFWAYKCDYHTGKRRQREREKQFAIPVEPIIGEATYREALAVIAENRDKKKGRSSNNYLLKSLIYCGECGRAQCGGVSPGNRQYRYYICQGRLKPNRGWEVGTGEDPIRRCSNRYWPVPMMDEAVWTLLENAIRHPEQFLEDWQKEQEDQAAVTQLQQELGVVQASVEELKGQRTRLVRLFTSGRIEEAVFDAEVRPIDSRLAQAEARLKDLQAAIRQRDEAGRQREGAVDILKRYQANLDNLTFDGKRWLVEEFIRRVDVFADGRVRVTGTLGDLQQHMGVYANQSYAQSHGGSPA